MSDHLTTTRLDAYRRRSLAPADLADTDSHLSGCESCRAALRSPINVPAASASVRGSLSDVTHLQFEEMESYLDGEAPPEIRAMVEAHVGICDRCARELRDLRNFVNLPAKAPQEEGLIPQQKPSGWMRVYAFRRLILGLASTAILIFVAANIYRLQSPPTNPSPADQLKKDQTQAPEQAPASAPPLALAQPATRTALLEWHDGPRRISIESTGQIHGLENFPPEYVSRIQNALGVAHFERPNAVEISWATRELPIARKHFPDSHLLLGVLNLHANHLPEARAEFSALLQENPNNPSAAALLTKLDELLR